MANLDKMLTTEMSDKQYQKWCDLWIKDYAASLVIECGMTKKEAKFHAEYDFEQFTGQAGDEARNEKILHERELELKEEEEEEEGDWLSDAAKAHQYDLQEAYLDDLGDEFWGDETNPVDTSKAYRWNGGKGPINET